MSIAVRAERDQQTDALGGGGDAPKLERNGVNGISGCCLVMSLNGVWGFNGDFKRPMRGRGSTVCHGVICDVGACERRLLHDEKEHY